MAAKTTLFTALARTVRGYRRVSFKSFSSRSEAVYQGPASIIDDYEHADDLKSRIFRVRLPKRSATNVLQKWVDEGREITASELRNISRDLRRSHRYKHALEISEWMVSHEEYQLSDSDYAVRIELMSKVFGIDAAERYYERLPVSAKTSETCTALLHSYAGLKLIDKAEEFFERIIKDANLTLSAITYNELMTLYLSVGQLEKIPSVIEDMKHENVALDLYTYNLWISSCASSLNIDEARRILGEMSLDSDRNECWVRYQKLADIYITSSHLANSGSNSLVGSEKGITQRELISYDFLVILQASFGNKEKLDQIWKSLSMTKHKMTGRNYVCIISSYLILGHLTEVAEIIEQWKQSATSDFNSSMCSKISEAFKEAGLPDEAASFLKLLEEKGCDLMNETQQGL